jgi:HD-like signal output (HDOD) protein
MTIGTLERLLEAMQDSNGIPARERSVASVLGALDSADEGKHQVVDFIVEDFALTQKVLALANSPMYAAFGKGAASVTAAMKVLGNDALMRVVLGTEVVTEEELSADDNLSRTLFASELARCAYEDRAEEASIATLMYEIGRLMTGRYLPQEAATIARLVADGSDPHTVETAVLGVTYQELGVELAARWNLPNFLLSIIDGSGDASLVGLAAFASSSSSLIHEGRLDEANELLRNLNLPGVDKERLGNLTRRKMDEMVRQNGIVPPQSAEQELLDLLGKLEQQSGLSFDAMLNAMLPEVTRLLGVAHCALLMMTRTGSFRVYAGFGKDQEAFRAQFKIAAEFKPTPFHAVILRSIDVSIDDVSRLKSASLPDGYRDLLPDVKKFILLPVANGSVRAMLYCDWESDRALSTGEMGAVSDLRNLLLPYMSS